MQIVQPSKFFSVTIFRTHFYRQYWHARVQTWVMLLFLVTLKNFDVSYQNILSDLPCTSHVQAYKPVHVHFLY